MNYQVHSRDVLTSSEYDKHTGYDLIKYVDDMPIQIQSLTYTIIMVRSNMILGLKLLLKIYMRVQEKLSVLLCFMMEFLLL